MLPVQARIRLQHGIIRGYDHGIIQSFTMPTGILLLRWGQAAMLARILLPCWLHERDTLPCRKGFVDFRK